MPINFTEINKKDSFPTPQYIHWRSFIKINWLNFDCRKLVYICFEKHAVLINILCGENTAILMVKLGGSYSYQGNFKNEGKK
jgi:hypothetical protein